MHAILEKMLKLQAFEFGEATGNNEPQIAELRIQIPQPFLGHYDRLRARDKKGVALVRNQVCTGCHMRLPIGTITLLMRGGDIQLCDSCGRYLVLAEEVEPSAPAATAEKPLDKPARKPRKRKTVAETL
jgi:predicted  nucleic acid-binding Zn-ribbon protein